MRRLEEIRKVVVKDESGSATFNVLSIGIAVLLFLLLTKMEGLMYMHTGGGFLLP